MFGRLINLIRGFFSLFIRGLEASNPQALIEAEKENLRNQIARFNEALANHAAFIERLTRQIKTLSQKEKELTAKIAANLKAGNRNLAGQLALQLQTVKQQLEENKQQLEMAEKTFKELEKSRDISIRDAQAKIEKLQNMLTEAELMEAQAQLQEMARGMISGISLANDALSRAQEIILEKRDKAAGRAKVASSSLDTAGIRMKEAEEQALAEQALAEFSAMYGIDINTGEVSQQNNTLNTEELLKQIQTEKELGPKQ